MENIPVLNALQWLKSKENVASFGFSLLIGDTFNVGFLAACIVTNDVKIIPDYLTECMGD